MALYKAVTTRKGHAASVRRQSRQRLRSDRRYRRNRCVPFYRQPVRIGGIAPVGACPDPTVISLPIQTCKKIGSRLRPRPGSGCLFKKGRKKRESIGKLILQRSAAEAEAPREAVAAALLLLLALILLGGLLAALLCGKVGKRSNKRLVKSHKKLRSV